MRAIHCLANLLTIAQHLLRHRIVEQCNTSLLSRHRSSFMIVYTTAVRETNGNTRARRLLQPQGDSTKAVSAAETAGNIGISGRLEEQLTKL